LAASGAPTTAHSLTALVELADHRRELLRDAQRVSDAQVAAVREAGAELTEARAESGRAEGERAAWEQRWYDLVYGLDLPEGDPDTVAAAVTTLARVAAELGHAAEADRRRARAA
ncbi:hypothetical protein, partial [Streptomyces sp. SID3343]|uniref:hypothetical protein n=1 Tax=Streptomyces sp. SID3343 TaxID=2690260 RepID=UPI001368F3F5